MTDEIADASVLANNEVVDVIANSISFTEGKGEQLIRPVSRGRGAVGQVFSRNVEMNFSTLKFSMPTTADNVTLARGWKTNANTNVFQVVAEGMTRTFTQAAVTNDYEVNIGSEGDIEIEVKSNAAI